MNGQTCQAQSVIKREISSNVAATINVHNSKKQQLMPARYVAVGRRNACDAIVSAYDATIKTREQNTTNDLVD